MPTSSYMPSVTCEVAFDGGFRVPMADWTWTDVSDYVELDAGISGSWGRQNERSQADANTLTLTFDNSDGRFTAARASSPYYPNVKLYKPIRVLADPVDGTEAPLFTGYITSWPVQWEDTSAYAKATVTAASRLARLGLNAKWRSIIEETILADSPAAYYPLGDPADSTIAADVSGLAAPPLTLAGDPALPVAFGNATGPGTDGLTAAEFAGGQYLSRHMASNMTAVEMFFLVPAVAASPQTLFNWRDGTITASIGASGLLVVYANGAPVATTGTSVADGQTRHLYVQWSTVNVITYLDGTLLSGVAAFPGSGAGTFNVGGGGPVGDISLTGTIAHVAAFASSITATRIAAHATAGDDGWAGELTDARFERYAAMAGIPAAEVDAETGSTTMAHVDTTDQNIADMLRVVESTEAGVMFDALDGTLTLHNRAHRYTGASVLTLDMAKHEVESDYSPRLDASALANDITVTGVIPAHVVDADSVEANGSATASLSTASEDVAEPIALAGWTRYKYADPKPRVPSLSVDVTNQAAFFAEGESTVSSADLLAVTIGDKITVANHPQQAATSITDYFVEGGTFSIGPESFRLTWNVSPTDAEDAVFILDSATQGVLDTNVLGL